MFHKPIIRSTKHPLSQHLNAGKEGALNELLKLCRIVINDYIEFIWNNEFDDHHGIQIWSIQKNLFELPRWLNYRILDEIKNADDPYWKISARLKTSLVAQAKGIVKGTVGEIRNLLRKIAWCKETGKPFHRLQAKLDKLSFGCPRLSEDAPIELSVHCVDFEKTNGRFKMFIRLKYLGPDFEDIKIPIQLHKRDFHWQKRAKLAPLQNQPTPFFGLSSGIRISESNCLLRWQFAKPEVRTEGAVLGGDTGIKKALSLSDGQMTKPNFHNRDLDTITSKMSKSKKGSKAFARLQDERINYINWSLKQLDLSNCAELKLERVKHLYFGRNHSAKIKAWGNTIITSSLERFSEEEGWVLSLTNSPYRSQRCGECGWVQRSNRKKECFCCKSCGHTADADVNAARNNAQDLPFISQIFRQKKHSTKGFFWNPLGISFGQESASFSSSSRTKKKIGVPDSMVK